MESLHIATVLKREQEESKLPLITNSHVIENFSDGQMSQRLNGFEIAELCLLFNFESSLTWRRKLLSLCSCQYLRRQVCTPEPYIRSLLYCSCLSKYTHLDPDGIIRLNMLHYLHRIEVVLKSQGNLMLLEDLM